MISFPNCKINLGLNVIKKRTDGYHEVTTVMYPVPKCDILEIIPNEKGVEFSSSGLFIPGDTSDNLCLKAYYLLAENYQLPAVSIHLHKEIPMGGGLGGGSSDGAHTLNQLNKLFNLNLSEDKLKEYAAKLGSDCAFFIANAPQYATGRGEVLTPIELDLSGYTLVLLNVGIHVSTKEAYVGIVPCQPDMPVEEIIQRPIHEWKDLLVNDFEASVFSSYPELANIKKSFYAAGALYAAMTGSGSTIFGIFKDIPHLDTPENGFLYVIEL